MIINKKGTRLPKLRLPVVVEGRYDKSAVLSMFSGTVITTEGFGIFNNREKQTLIRKVAEDGIILLTDSDGGGVQIRSFLSGILPREKIYHLYIPKIEGKESRKAHRGRAGLLGVEGVGGEVLRELLMPFTEEGEGEVQRDELTSFDMFTLGLSGHDGASVLRDALCRMLSLPEGMSAKALMAALNIVSCKETVEKIVKNLTIN